MLDRENMLLAYGSREDLGIFADFHNDENNGYVKDWHVRLIFEHPVNSCETTVLRPMIEFYALDAGGSHYAGRYDFARESRVGLPRG